jgi:pilus assembly protein TadC
VIGQSLRVGWAPWALLAGAAWLTAPAGAVRRRGTHRGAPSVGGARRRLPVTAAGACVIACAAVGGWPYGFVAALVLGPVAAWAIGRVERTQHIPPADDSVALALDLAAAALRAGQTVPDALRLVAPVTPSFGGVIARVSGLLRLGADPRDAWSAVPAGTVLVSVARTAVRSDVSGARLAAAFERSADRIRADLRAAGLARAARAGVSVLAPLGLCFLPAFVCLGIAPTVVGIARSTLSPIV